MLLFFLCFLTMVYEVAPSIEPSNNDDNDEELIYNDILGSEFENNIGNFPPINTQIEIEKEYLSVI